MIRKRRIVAVLAPIAPSAFAFAGAAPPDRAGASDFQRLVSTGSPAVAPDGKRAAIVVSSADWENDKRVHDLILVDLATRTQQTLLVHRSGLSDPAFSPDGSQIAFLADDDAKDSHSQIYVIPVTGGIMTAWMISKYHIWKAAVSGASVNDWTADTAPPTIVSPTSISSTARRSWAITAPSGAVLPRSHTSPT